MGEVYLAYDSRLERHVAIKRIRADALHGQRQRARFRHEALAVDRLHHPAIVQVYELLEIESGDCLVMENVVGTPLVRLCRDRPLELVFALRLARGIVRRANGEGSSSASTRST